MPSLAKGHPYLQIAKNLGQELTSQYKAGDLIPSETDLAKRYSVSPNTISKALNVLSDQGLIRRYHRRGTVVVDRLATGEFAVVLRPQLLAQEASPYYRMASTSIMDALHAENARWNIRMHLGKATTSGTEYPSTLDLTEPEILKRLRGVFSFHPLYELENTLQSARVPVVELGARAGGNSYQVVFDDQSWYGEAISHLRQVGCRRLGLLWGGAARPLEPHEQRDRMVSEIALALGLECRPEWMPFHPGDITERGGYELFMRFWHQPERPDGILVCDDILCRGVLRAILQLGIKLPDHLRLVTNAGTNVELPYHLPVTRVEFDAKDQARQAVAMMLTLLNGRIPEQRRIVMPGKLVKGSTT